MRMRLLVATAIVGALVPAFGAHAETCGLVEDPTNDTQWIDHSETNGVLPDSTIDIVSADIATDDKTLYAVIRVASLWGDGPTGWFSSGGGVYRMEFKAKGRTLFVSAGQGNGIFGEDYTSWGYYAGTVGLRSRQVTGAFDYEGNEIRVQAPMKYFAGTKLTTGDRISDITVTAVSRYARTGQIAPGVSGDLKVADSAAGNTAYVAGEESCVDLVEDRDPFPWAGECGCSGSGSGSGSGEKR